MTRYGTAFFLFLLFFSLHFKAQKFEKLYQYVNPFIGTEKMGHTYPGATAPFGAVQLSPETDTITYELNGKYNGELLPSTDYWFVVKRENGKEHRGHFALKR